MPDSYLPYENLGYWNLTSWHTSEKGKKMVEEKKDIFLKTVYLQL